jgi:hypothetical protein
MSRTLRKLLWNLPPSWRRRFPRLLAVSPRKEVAVADYMIPVPLPGARVPDEPGESWYSWAQTEPMD